MAASPEFEVILGRLKDLAQPLGMSSLYHLSDLADADLQALEEVWDGLPADRRLNVLSDLSEIGEANFEVNFEAVYRLGLEDDSPEVRATAIRALWESEAPDLIAPLIRFLQTDADTQVRAAAASALGRFVYLGEVEEIPPAQARRAEDALLAVINGGDDLDVRRRALEAVSFSSRPEVPPLIRAAYESGDARLRVSAVFAMGRSADERWSSEVQAEMESQEPEMRFEAARAAGELGLSEAAAGLATLTEDADSQVQEAAIWSLGQVGGDLARETLNNLLEESEDEDEQDYIQEALDNLDFTDEVNRFTLFEVDADDDEDIEGDEDDES